jgi:hypothetical protein
MGPEKLELPPEIHTLPVAKRSRRGFNPGEINVSATGFQPISAEYDKKGTDPLGSTISVLH